MSVSRVGLVVAVPMLVAVFVVNVAGVEVRALLAPRALAANQWTCGLTPDGRYRVQASLFGQTVVFESGTPTP